MDFLDLLRRPWPWYVAGPIIGLSVPFLLIAGNKLLGISGTLRQVCAMCFPANIPFLKYNWKAQSWNLFFAAGLLLGGYIGGVLLRSPTLPNISSATIRELNAMGISYDNDMLPSEIFSWANLLTWQNLLIVVGGGFLVGFGTRYAGGCTSGHGIAGLSTLQWHRWLPLSCFLQVVF